jgi:hypothetical protein
MLHDWFNALCWLRWPAIKAHLNRLQATAISAGAAGSVRGPLRDAVTLFDESGALFVSDDPKAIAQWRGLDWQGLFVADRQRFLAQVRVLVVGHALLEKLLTPYKGICAQALLAAPIGHSNPGGALDPLDALDQRVAGQLDAQALARERFGPLPLLGIPGWWPRNEDPAFYNDPRVFRRGRHRRGES